MNLFAQRSVSLPAEHIQYIKDWVRELLNLEQDIPISMSQLHCHEPDYPWWEPLLQL